jgi:hypothetical protein
VVEVIMVILIEQLLVEVEQVVIEHLFQVPLE